MNASNSPIGTGSKILVTGGTGFLGAYIIKALVDEGYCVRAIRRNGKLPFFIPAKTFEPVEWVDADILDIPKLEEVMESMDVVIHAAAKVSYEQDEKKEIFRTNIDGTANVVNIALDKKIKKLIYISSVAALGKSLPGATIDERKHWDEIKTETNYAASKYHAEMEVWRAIGEGLNAIIVNPSLVIGYGDWNNGSCAIFKSVFNEFPWYTNGVTGFVDVEDIARSVLLLMKTEIQGERFLLNGENWPFRQLFNTIADGFSKKHPVWEANPLLGSIAWRLEKLKSLLTGKKTLLTRENAKSAQGITYYENSKILQYLPGFRFTPLQDTIRIACRAYLENAQLK
jgi:dihydroflavonol-4-reductase